MKKVLKDIVESTLDNNVDKNKVDILIKELSSDESILEKYNLLVKELFSHSESFLKIKEIKYRVTNAGVGKNKKLDIDILEINQEDINKYKINNINGLEDIGGLSYNKETNTIEGIAEKEGNFELTIEGIYFIQDNIKQKTRGKVILKVIPDPKSLWKTIEPDKKTPYGKPHEDSKIISNNDYKLVYASKRGRSHAHNGTYRDDDANIMFSKSGWSIVAVADGGGSYSLARRGSEIVIKKLFDALDNVLDSKGKELEENYFKNIEIKSEETKNNLDKILSKTILSSIYTAIVAVEEEAKNNNNKFQDYSTTLLVSISKKTANGNLIISFWVGDGAIVIYEKNKKITLMGKADSGEFAGQTQFLDRSSIQDLSRINIELIKDFTSLILATDGVTDPFFDTDDSLKNLDTWNKLWDELSIDNFEKYNEYLLSWLDFWSKGNHDDRTIALLIPNTNQEININSAENNSKTESLLLEYNNKG